MTEEEASYNSYENESYAYEIDGVQGYGMHPHHLHPRHSHIPADHLDSRGNSRLWHEPDYLPLDSDGAIPAVSTLGRGPRGTGLVVDCDEGEDKFYLTIRDDVLGEVQYQTENLHAGKVSAHQVKGTPQPGLPTKFYIDVTRDGTTTSYPIVANPAAPGTRFYLLDRPVKQQKHRRLADAYECESDELTHYVRGRWNNFPPPRPGDCIFCVVQSCNKTKEYSLGIGIIYSNDNGHICFFVRTILNTSAPWINEDTGTWWVGNVDTNVVYTCIVSNVFFEMLDCEQEPKSKVIDNEDGTCDITLYLPKAHEYSAGYGMLYSDDQNLHEFSIDTNIIATIEYTDEAIAQALAQANAYTDETVEATNANILSRLENLQDEIDNLDTSGSSFSAGTGIEISEEHIISAEPAIKQANEYTDTEISKVQTEIDELSENLGSVYSAGDGISISNDNVISADSTIARTSDLDEARTELTTYIDEKDTSLQQQINNLVAGEGGLYTAGYGIEISNTNQISIDSIVLNQLIDNAITDALKYVYWDDEGYLIHNIEKTAFAVYCAKDGSLTFYYGSSVPSASSTYNGKTVTAVYEGFDTAEYTHASFVPWYSHESDIISVVFDESFADVQPISTAYWFCNFTNCTSIDLTYLDTSNVTDMSDMFEYCSNLTEVDVSNFDTSQVTSMSYMFAYCESLTEIDVRSFDTSNVTNMYSMFYLCSSLTGLDVSGFDTSSVTNMGSMFRDCSSLADVDFSGADTSSVTNMNYMFWNCSSLADVDFSGSDMSSVKDMSYMFRGCSSLTDVDFSGSDMSSVTNMGSMFYNCSSLTDVDFSGADTSSVTNMNYMFYNCSSLTEVDVSNFDTSSVTNMSYMFRDCSSLTTIYSDDSMFVTTAVTNDTHMFYNCPKLVGGNGTTFDSSKITSTMAHVDTADNPGYFTDVSGPGRVGQY